MNPILPIAYFIPDVEARQWSDGRMYLYGSYDIRGNTAYCSDRYHVFSSADLLNWTDHGISFQTDGGTLPANVPGLPLYAPDCVYRDGSYYLYYCLADGTEGVAISEHPAGPFQASALVEGAHGEGIDPAVFIDDDGIAYYYWGQFKARGARLSDDMASIVAETRQDELLNEEEHGFHEGAAVRKRGELYYLVYTDTSRGKATSIAYATSTSPLGPFRRGGIIVDNDGCDSQTWNNHGSIAEFNGRWYVFYHRSSHGMKFSRRVCAEPIEFLHDGSIPEVEMTTQGVSGPLDALATLDAYRACLLSGKVHTETDERMADGKSPEYLAMIESDDWAAFKYVDFGEGVGSFQVEAATLTAGGEIELRLDRPDGPLIGVCGIESTGGWSEWRSFSCDVTGAAGVHALYLVFKGRQPGRLFNIHSFAFAKESNRHA